MSGSWLPPQALLLFARPGSRPPLPIETAVLDGFRAVLGRQCFGADQIGDRARHLEHTVVTAGGEPEARHGGGEEALGLGGNRAKAPDLAGAHRGVDADSRPAEALALSLARRAHAQADRLGRVACHSGPKVCGSKRGELDVQVDAVQERARETAEVSGPLGRSADAMVEGRATAPARIGGRDELESSREIADATRSRDRDAAVFERLAQRLEHVLLELG